MRLISLKRFDKAIRLLPQSIRKKFKEKIEFLLIDFRHPSLHCKKIKGTQDLWEARIDIQYRLTFQIFEDTIILRNIGNHDETLKNP